MMNVQVKGKQYTTVWPKSPEKDGVPRQAVYKP